MLTHAMIVSETSVDLHWLLDTVPKKGCHSNGERLYPTSIRGRRGRPPRDRVARSRLRGLGRRSRLTPKTATAEETTTEAPRCTRTNQQRPQRHLVCLTAALRKRTTPSQQSNK